MSVRTIQSVQMDLSFYNVEGEFLWDYLTGLVVLKKKKDL